MAVKGYCILDNLVDTAQLEKFERQITAIGRRECAKLSLDPGAAEPLIAVLDMDQAYRVFMFDKLKQLWVLREIAATVMERLNAVDFFERSGICVPTVHQTLKGDLPGDPTYTFPFHQDFRLIRSHRTYRLWIPLRDVGVTAGTIEIAAGSHKDRFDFVRDGTDYPHIPDDKISGVYDTQVFTLSAGSAVLFNPHAAHRSVAGTSDRIRFVLILHIEDITALFTHEEHEQIWPGTKL